MRFLKWTGWVLGFYFMTVMPAIAATASSSNADGDSWLLGLDAGLTIALAVIAGAFAQAKTASTALEAIGRNPSAQAKIFVPMIVALALIESLVIYALVVVFAKM